MFHCLACLKEYDNKWIINGKTYYIYDDLDKRGQRKRAYCYYCRPPEDKTRRKLKLEHRTEKACTHCKETKNINDFRIRKYSDKQGETLWCHTSECRQCENTKALNKVRETKRLCVEYKGGKCSSCGYNKSNAALDFHHKNKCEKSFNLSSKKHLSLDKLKEELDKCDLLCSNCHRELEEI